MLCNLSPGNLDVLHSYRHMMKPLECKADQDKMKPIPPKLAEHNRQKTAKAWTNASYTACSITDSFN